MSKKTKIQWCDATWNPWIGCTKVSAGCKNCYAEMTTRARVLRSGGQETWGKGAKRSRTSDATWGKPGQWNTAARGCGHQPKIFPSLCDWLDDEIPIEWLIDFLTLMAETPHLRWILLTKRPENWEPQLSACHERMFNSDNGAADMVYDWLHGGGSPQNLWIGASVENQQLADKRIPELLKIPAKVRFLSCEPLLGPIDLGHSTPCGYYCDESDLHVDHQFWVTHIRGDIHWVIVGGESGRKARPCDVDWIRSIISQCKSAQVPCFVKQIGRDPHWSEMDMLAGWYEVFSDPKGGDPEQWPRDLRVRQFPVSEARS